MHDHRRARVKHFASRIIRRGAAALALTAGLAASAEAQIVVSCTPTSGGDFDIADDLGRHTFGNTIHLTGRQGSSSNVGEFYLINSNSAESDVDLDGYVPTAGCDFNNIFVASRGNLTNVDDPALAIPGENIIVVNLPELLFSGERVQVQASVEIPTGTVAGRYIGYIEVRDSVRGPYFSVTNDFLNRDLVYVEITVLEQSDLTIVSPDEAEELDSVVVRGRAGQRASAVFRLANSGNTALTDVRFSATDLRSQSAIGLVIPSERISFAAPSLASLGVADTARITVTVDIPRGILGGRYRGAIIVQSGATAEERIPLIVIVTSTRGLLFADNPVRSALGDFARIAFNGDPGTIYELGIFDMTGRLVWSDDGTVFPGAGGTPTVPTPDADFAVNYTWPLTNGRGENVASGMYLVVVQSIVNGERTLAQDKLMVIR